MITERIGQHKVLLPISNNHYNFREQMAVTNKQSFCLIYEIRRSNAMAFAVQLLRHDE